MTAALPPETPPRDRARAASQPLQPLSWAGWAAAVATIATLTRQPVYLLLLLASIGAVRWRCVQEPEKHSLSSLRLGLLLFASTALANWAMVRAGTTELFALPTWIPLLGGAWTLEALAYGALNGLALAALLVGFSLLHQVVAVRALLRLTPRAYYPVAVVLSIAVTFVPTTLLQLQQIREAQAVRGHRLRGVRSWLPLIVPLLEGGLERSLQLAEAMVARGFASPAAPHARRAQGLALAGFASLVVGWLLQLAIGTLWWTSLPMVGGGAALLIGLWHAGRQHPYTVYRPHPWQRRDWIVLAGALLAAGAYLLPVFDRSTLFYSPYPTLTGPALDWRIGLATAGLLFPALLLETR
ncbi:MAG: energy-coupling factor transporter transmembrane component T [Caldilinea sp.]